MNQKLSGLDRINIQKILPTEGSILEQQTVREILDMIAIKTEEFEEFNLKEDRINNRLNWDIEKIKIEKEFDLKKPHVQVMKDAVDRLDKEKKISQLILPTCERIKSLR